jgi:hypothetical protein
MDKLEEVLKASWAPGTIEGYSTGLAAFHTYCDYLQIPETQRAPASRELIEFFTAALAGTYSDSTISNYLCGIRAWHIIHGLPFAVDRNTMQTILHGAAKLAPPEAKRAKRPPLLVVTIRSIKSQLFLNNPFDAAVYACLTTTFWCASRLGEFTVTNRDKIDPRIHIKRSDAEYRTSDRHEIPQYVFHLPWTKTAACGEDVFWSPREGDEADPLSALNNHFAINNPMPNSPLFSYSNSGKQYPRHLALSKYAFLKRVNTALKNIDLPPIQGHSIRIGSVLEHLLQGSTFEAVKHKGHWKSEAFSKYL